MNARRPLTLALLSTAALLAAGCDRPQDASRPVSQREHGAVWQGTKDGFSAPGWQAGDRTSWDNHMRNRTQRGQNEYTRIRGPGAS